MVDVGDVGDDFEVFATAQSQVDCGDVSAEQDDVAAVGVHVGEGAVGGIDVVGAYDQADDGFGFALDDGFQEFSGDEGGKAGEEDVASGFFLGLG